MTIFEQLILKIIANRKDAFGKTKHQDFFNALHKLGLKGMNFGNGSLPSQSGEDQVLKFLKPFLPENPIIFDCGANFGNYSKLILEHFYNAQVFAFEPDPANFKILTQKLHGDNIQIFNLGLGIITEKKELFRSEAYPGISSVYQRDLTHINTSMKAIGEIPFISIDDFSKQHNIEKIDFLKLDTEGNELNILLGATNMLSQGSIKNIQFEFGGCNIDARTYFKDFFNLLIANFKIFRILKDGLYPITKYSEILEVYMTSNFLAVLKK